MKAKLKLLLLMLSVITISTSLFVSCSSISCDANGGICGRWQIIDCALYFKNGIHKSVDRPMNYFLEIYDDGSCSIISDGELYSGDYKLADDSIELDFNYYDSTIGVMAKHELKGDELVLYTEKNDFPVEGIAYFKRVRDSEIRDSIERVDRANVGVYSGVKPIVLFNDGTAILAGRNATYEIGDDKLTLVEKDETFEGLTHDIELHDEYMFFEDRVQAIRYDIPTKNTIRGVYDIVDEDVMIVINKDKMYIMARGEEKNQLMVGKYKVTQKSKQHYKVTARLRYYDSDDPQQKIEFVVKINPSNGKAEILEITSHLDIIKECGNIFTRFYMDNYCYREIVDE